MRRHELSDEEWRLKPVDKLSELQSSVYVALMNRNGNWSRFPMPPGTSSRHRALLSPVSRGSET
jgi:hypothetical protein